MGHPVTQVIDPAILKKYEDLSVKPIDMIGDHRNLFNTLLFKNRKYLDMIPDPITIAAPPTSANSSRDSSVERHHNHKKNHDHVKPPQLSFDARVIEVTRWKESFMAWMVLNCHPDPVDKDLGYLLQSMLSLVNKRWYTTLYNHPGCKDGKKDKIFKVIDDTMLVKHPIYLHRVNFAAISLQDGDDPGTFLRRIIKAGRAADMAQCPIETQYLLSFCQSVNNSE